LRAAAGLNDRLFDTEPPMKPEVRLFTDKRLEAEPPLSLRPTTEGRQVPDGVVQDWKLPP